MRFPLPYRAEHGFDSLYGLEITDLSERTARGTVTVADALKQPAGLVHGGVFAAIAESLASLGTWASVGSDENFVAGQSNHTSFLRPITAGTIHAAATSRHRGRTSWVWDVEISDDQSRLCALSRVTIAVRPGRP